MLKALPISLPKEAFLTVPIEHEELLFECALDNWDREGFELLPIEQEYYRANGIALTQKDVIAKESGAGDHWKASIQKWFVQEVAHPNIYIDHSYVCVGYELAGAAREQVARIAKQRPELNKFLYTRRKYGTDFCIDWIDEFGVTEIVHFEWDFLARDYARLIEHYELVERKILTIDWPHLAKHIMDQRSKWEQLDSDSQGDFKAKYLGLPQAFRLENRIVL